MENQDLLRILSRKGVNLEKVAVGVKKQPELVNPLLEFLSTGKGRVKFGALKALLLVSEKDPQVLYPFFGSFTALLDGENQVLKWGAIRVIGNLAPVDTRSKISRLLPGYLAPIAGPDLATAANVIAGATKIALARPRLADKIVTAILAVEKGKYRTPECRNIALGKAIDAFDQLFERTRLREPVAELVKNQLGNSRNATRKKAERFCKRWLGSVTSPKRAARETPRSR